MALSPVSPSFSDSLLRRPVAAPPLSIDRPISFYACGITPYAPAHIGHARSFVVFDLMASVLRRAGHQVDLVRNVTDVDDKIIAAAAKQGIDWKTLSHRQAARNREQLRALGVDGFEEPYASDHMPAIVAFVQRLLDKGHAYLSASGDVLFEVSSYKGAALMPHEEEALLSHGQARVDASGKRSPVDFVLWKPAKPGEPAWESPWGLGRPGWHIECSAMIEARFGTTLDYHGGGTDLRFPHHQAEIQQSEAAYDRPLAHRWVHHGSVHDELGRKMSKSLGNYVELSDGLEQAESVLLGAGGSVLRLALLSTLWTKPLDWAGPSVLAQSATSLQTWAEAAGNAAANPVAGQAFDQHLFANLNTPKAYAQLHAWAKAAFNGNQEAAGAIAHALDVLGVPESVYRALPRLKASEPVPAAIEALVARRAHYRAQKDWAGADALRQELERQGYAVEDSPSGAKARRLRP
jgi:cysteinyl-tRNA synthetase